MVIQYYDTLLNLIDEAGSDTLTPLISVGSHSQFLFPHRYSNIALFRIGKSRARLSLSRTCSVVVKGETDSIICTSLSHLQLSTVLYQYCTRLLRTLLITGPYGVRIFPSFRSRASMPACIAGFSFFLESFHVTLSPFPLSLSLSLFLSPGELIAQTRSRERAHKI